MCLPRCKSEIEPVESDESISVASTHHERLYMHFLKNSRVVVLFLCVSSLSWAGNDSKNLTLTLKTPDTRALSDTPHCKVKVEVIAWAPHRKPNDPFLTEVMGTIDPSRITSGPLNQTFELSEGYSFKTYTVAWRFKNQNQDRESLLSNSGRLLNRTPPIESNFRRIEVPDMKLRRSDGSAYTKKGFVSVSIPDDYGSPDLCVFITGHGIDVPAGFRYRVKTTDSWEDDFDESKWDDEPLPTEYEDDDAIYSNRVYDFR